MARTFQDVTDSIPYSRLNVLITAIDEINREYSDIGIITLNHNNTYGEISFTPKSVRYTESSDVEKFADRMAHVLAILKALTYIDYSIDVTIPDENLTDEEFTDLVDEVVYYLDDTDYDSYYSWERTGERIASILYSVYSDYQEDDDE